MHYRLTKFARNVIIINVVLAVIIGAFHGYNVYRIENTENIIEAKMEEAGTFRIAAIKLLEREGVDLFLGFELETYGGLILSFTTIILMMRFYKSNGFILGFIAGFCAMFTSFIGGILMFYALFSGKSQTSIRVGKVDLSNADAFTQYIHGRVEAEN